MVKRPVVKAAFGIRKQEDRCSMRIAVLTGGGDCPGLNGAVKWVTKTALDPLLEEKRSIKFDVLGIKEGWKGLVEVDSR
jgi:6-phosphofructokinase 1